MKSTVPEDHADASLRRLCGVLARELRNPLSVIRTTIDVMETDPQSHVRLHGTLKLQTERLTHLIDDLSGMSRFAPGKTRVQKQAIQLEVIIDEALQSTESAFIAKQQQVVLENASDAFDETWIDGDRFQLTQVLIDLLSNASKFSDTGDVIQIDVQADCDNVEIRVSDQGIGIAPDQLPTIFDCFSKSQSVESFNHSEHGLGIGLGLVKGLIEMHRGSVSAYSDGTNKGSTFIVRLPVAQPW